MNAFTCTGPYAILILAGIKRTENRSAWPSPSDPPSLELRRTSGRAAISCSKSFCKEEYGQFIAWASVNLPPEDFEKLPSWREVKDWPGKIVGVCDYKARTRETHAPTDLRQSRGDTPYQAELFANEQTTQLPNQQTISWDEGYQYWWDLSNVMRLPEPIPCRGNVGMWPLPPSIAQSVLEQVHSLQTVAVLSHPTEVHSLQTVKSVEANAAAVRIETPDDAYPLFRAAVPLAGAREGFFVLPIDAQRCPICKPVLVSLGHLPGTAAIELGEIFREAFKVNADAIIVAHNHPSGDPTPSKADLQLTTTLQSAANLLGIKFLDHLILGSPDSEDGRGYLSVMELSDK